MVIISIEALDGVHQIESQSNRYCVWLPGYIEVPAHLQSIAWDSKGYCKLKIENNRLVDITQIEIPKVQDITPPPSPEEQLRADVDYLAALQGVIL